MSSRRFHTHNGLRKAVDAGEVTKSPSLLPHGYLRTVACPDCPAEIGDTCTSSTGRAMSTTHISRRRIAIRKYRAEQEES